MHTGGQAKGSFILLLPFSVAASGPEPGYFQDLFLGPTQHACRVLTSCVSGMSPIGLPAPHPPLQGSIVEATSLSAGTNLKDISGDAQ